MTYYIAKTVAKSFERALEKVGDELKKQGLVVISDTDMSGTLKEKLDVAIPRYRILGVMHPASAHKALEADDKMGLFVSCSVIVQERSATVSEVSAVDPRSVFASVEHTALEEFARQIGPKLDAAISHV